MWTSNTLAENLYKNMKQINITLFSLMLLTILFSCSRSNLNYTQNGNWVSRATFSGIAMGEGACFVINNVAYVGTGINPLTPNQKLNTMFSYTASNIPTTPYGYDSSYGSWAQVQAFPGQPRSNAVGFNIGGTVGYIGAGLANDGYTALADFYSYTPGSGWSQIDSIHDDSASYPRFDAVAFSFDTTAYVLTGTNYYYYFTDCWRYSPSTNSWIEQQYFPGSERSGAASFIYKNKGYIVTGYSPGGTKWSTGTSCYDFWAFTPMSDTSTQSWTRLRDIYNTSPSTYDDGYTNIIRRNAAAFTILGQYDGDKGYITLGSNNGTDVTFTWEYDFASDLWTEKTPYEGTARTGAVGFSLIGNVPAIAGAQTSRGFVATGLNQGSTAGFSDCEEFFPLLPYNQYD
jgi:N-acetylneuraminic acid mutarotase